MTLIATLPTTSTVASYNLNLLEIIEEAYERAGGEMKSGYSLRTAKRSINLLLAEWANKGLNLWTLETGTEAVTAGSPYYQLAADTVDVLDIVRRSGTGTSQADYQMNRISASEYQQIYNKNMQAPPLQVWVDRVSTGPILVLWPVPDTSYTLAYTRLRRIADFTSATANADVPFRFLPALVAGLALKLAMKIPEGQSRLQTLADDYLATFQAATDEDREKGSFRAVPYVRVR